MKIGVVDVDNKWPNLPLMKLSAFHKSKGDLVEFANIYDKYDIVYQSKVFSFTPDFKTSLNTDKLILGGSAYDKELTEWLPPEIEHIYPDYYLYGESKTAYGFLTRGCPRGCPFCIVGKKEGLKSYKVADLKEFWNKQPEINLLDPNLLACEDSIALLKQVRDSQARINFSQGLDIRFMTDEVAYIIKDVRTKLVHFAWDRMKDEKIIVPKLKRFKEITNIDYRKAAVYVLTNFESSIEEDLYRIQVLRDMGYKPFIMVYDKCHASFEHRDIANYVNSPQIFWMVPSYKDYVRTNGRKMRYDNSKLNYDEK